MRLARRRSDGAIFRASNPGYPSMNPWYYFRRVQWDGPKWYRPWGRWKDTGEIWEHSTNDFDVLTSREARKSAT